MQVKNDNGEIVATEKNNSQELGHAMCCVRHRFNSVVSCFQGELKIDNERLRAQIKEALRQRAPSARVGVASSAFGEARFRRMRKKRRLCEACCASMSPNAESSCNTDSTLEG